MRRRRIPAYIEIPLVLVAAFALAAVIHTFILQPVAVAIERLLGIQ